MNTPTGDLRARLLAAEIVRAFEIKLRVWADTMPDSAASDFMATITWADSALSALPAGGEPRLQDGDVHTIACVLAREDGYDPADEHGGLYDLRWSGGPNPEPEGDAWHMDYMPKAERIVAALGGITTPPPDADVGAQGDGAWVPVEPTHEMELALSDALASGDYSIGECLQRANAAAPAAGKEEMSPEFTDSARAAIAWVLYHHQGGSSAIGQPLRFALGMGNHEPLPEWRIAEAKAWAEVCGETENFRREAALTRQPVAGDGGQATKNAFHDGVILALQVLTSGGDMGNAHYVELVNCCGLDELVKRAKAEGMLKLSGLSDYRRRESKRAAPAATPTDGGEGSK